MCGGECLCDEGLSEKSRLVEFVFCSLYTSSQLRDKTDKPAPPLPPPHLPFLASSFLSLLFGVSSLSSLPFILLLPCSAGVDFSYWKWPSSDVNFLTTSSPLLQQSHKPKGHFFSSPHFTSQTKMHSLEVVNPKKDFCTFCNENFMTPKAVHGCGLQYIRKGVLGKIQALFIMSSCVEFT